MEVTTQLQRLQASTATGLSLQIPILPSSNAEETSDVRYTEQFLQKKYMIGFKLQTEKIISLGFFYIVGSKRDTTHCVATRSSSQEFIRVHGGVTRDVAAAE